ncbi:SgcJ/EcaC family oxidoreductase [Solihabitans fulvus]|uniref:SgcJ/EcaC family oxidoreductase n=1 Tax=Solihabitans fulvus TaxID=1892852 RepID=A0A5B2WW92_9PSEU|nr:SgcJ/EcaC family oxidoreductase [Solihabitans fulvus]KAA2255991.1 SgcJ/EcaC family oxidoreductase [Solihabitans fulvus]
MNSHSTAQVLTEDDRAVRAVLDGVYAAWVDNDADAFVASYAENATTVLPGLLQGDRAAVRDRMAASFAGPLKGSHAVDEVQSVRFFGEDTAVVVSRGAVVMAGETEPPAGRAVLATWVLFRQHGEWLVVAYHNCPAETA